MVEVRYCVTLSVLSAMFVKIQGGPGECFNVTTSDGVRTLLHGEKACAPLNKGETGADLGLRYVTCYSGSVTVKACVPPFRFHAEKDQCAPPDIAKCSRKNYSLSRIASKRKTQAPPEGPCSPRNCNLPQCFCYGAEPNMAVADRPQFIMVTFDDAVSTWLYEQYYGPMFVDNKFQVFNPSGCPLRAAFFVSDKNTNYDKVLKLWQAGHEIVSHTINHELPPGHVDTDYPDMVAEIDGERQRVLKVLNNKALVESMKGFRSPFLKVAHDVQYDVLYDHNFLYDTSVTSMEMWFGKNPLWPCTLDFELGRCINPPCPTNSYPGLWEIIMNAWIADDGHPCSMVDSCLTYNYSTAKQSDWIKIFDDNFSLFYKTKVPMDYFTHGLMFDLSKTSFSALGNWLHRMRKDYSDVWIVTPQQVLQWMRNPLTNAEMKAQKWGC
ncbi:chitin deacetylase 8 [Biomphalaria pfeifferi]|uniref:Chitin deacetylase 8 n=1 Tax=Biomphalaria pfeifferi TaxID=112525 RepID=A0AAD8B9F5_BIOPF|nr:chitin deacetylase 8 [Biomphalaria pfeifferi]